MANRIFAAGSSWELASRNDFTETGGGPRVLLAYEDFAMVLRALAVFALIAREAGIEAETQLSLWRFGSCECPEKRETAAVLAQRADIIIVALRCGHDFPVQLAWWIEQRIGCRTPHDGALVVILDSATTPEAVRSEVVVHLQGVAETVGMDFFCGGPIRAAGGSDPVSLASGTRGNAADNTDDEMDGRSSPSGLGINE